MAQSWGLESARSVLQEWAERHVSEAAKSCGLSVQFSGVEAWLLAQNPQTLGEAERILEVLEVYQADTKDAQRASDMDRLVKAAGEHRRDGCAQSRVSHSFAPRAYGPLGGRA